MTEPFVLFPLIAGLLYAIAAMCAKRSTSAGIGPFRTTFMMNLVLGLVGAPFFFFGDPLSGWGDLIGPLIVSALFFSAQLLGFLAIHKGDVSVVTPLMGVKAVIVGILSLFFFEEAQSAGVFAGAALSAVAIFLIRGDTHAERERLLPSIILGLACAACFALMDVVMQLYGSQLGFEKMASLTFVFVFLWSFSLLPFFHGSLSGVSRATFGWLLGGSLLMAIQATCMAYAISEYGKATIVNIVYSSRGLWSVLLVWLVGHWFSNEEQQLGKGAMVRRLAGALSLIAAIYLALS